MSVETETIFSFLFQHQVWRYASKSYQPKLEGATCFRSIADRARSCRRCVGNRGGLAASYTGLGPKQTFSVLLYILFFQVPRFGNDGHCARQPPTNGYPSIWQTAAALFLMLLWPIAPAGQPHTSTFELNCRSIAQHICAEVLQVVRNKIFQHVLHLAKSTPPKDKCVAT